MRASCNIYKLRLREHVSTHLIPAVRFIYEVGPSRDIQGITRAGASIEGMSFLHVIRNLVVGATEPVNNDFGLGDLRYEGRICLLSARILNEQARAYRGPVGFLLVMNS